jgi:heparan-alpha-glucosaminide N-acetyltransferase
MNATTTTSPEVTSIGLAGQPVTTRIASIDIFRGMTIAVMIFVNELGEVRGLPRWTYHAHMMENRMTYVDMVFPFFLFIVGLSIPLSVKQRLKKSNSAVALWGHVILRSFSLVVLGLILANAEKGGAPLIGLSGATWTVIALVGAALYLNVYPQSQRWRPLFGVMRTVGIAVLAAMLVLFRPTAHTGHVAWLDASYTEILGLIGFTYFAVCLLYIPTRKWLWAPLAWFVLLVLLCALSTTKILNFPNRLPFWFWPFGNGAMACIVMAGVVTSAIFLGSHRWQSQRQKMLVGAGFGLSMLAAGWALAPLGISKVRATPTWALVSIGAAALIFTGLYWICDVRKRTAGFAFLRPAGSNTLLTYLVPDLWNFLFASLGIAYLNIHWSVGWPGVVKTLLFTALMLAIAAALTRMKVRLQL